MNNKYTFFRINLILLFTSILILSMDFSVNGNIQVYQFSQLDEFFEEDLFGIKLDYNSGSPGSTALHLISNIITGENIPNQTDPDPTMDNIIALVGHESQDIHSAFFAVDNVRKTEYIPIIGPIEWQASLPFVKHLILYELPSGENVVMSQDFLGMALRLEGQDFDYNHYQVGYANIPIDFLDFFSDALTSNFSQIFPNTSSSPMSIDVFNTENDLTIKTTYYNTTYLFQTHSIDFEYVSSFDISDHFLMIQFDTVEITVSMIKHSNSMASGVETHFNIRVGNVMNLIINEERPDEETWNQSYEKHVETSYNRYVNLNNTFSWYRGEEISKRLSLFNKTSLSLLISQNIGILDGTQNADNFKIELSGQNISKEVLSQSDYTVNGNITVLHNEEILSSTIVDGYNFALEEDPQTKIMSITTAPFNLIPLNYLHPNLDNNILFLKETSLINELVAESIKRFIASDNLTRLTTDEILKVTKSYLTKAIYVQNLQIEGWKGYPSTVQLLHGGLRKYNKDIPNNRNITSYPFLTSIGILVIYFKISSRKSRKQVKISSKN
ncbi:MAG: hypothetical protein ACW99Q_19855 [Candidatus Kariarchaeaceae archaeon]